MSIEIKYLSCGGPITLATFQSTEGINYGFKMKEISLNCFFIRKV